jgi:hypothetical protein
MMKTRHDIEYHSSKVDKIPNSVGIVPYSDRWWRSDNKNYSASLSKLVHLIKSISSLSMYVTETHLFCADKEKVQFLCNYFHNLFIHEVDPGTDVDTNRPVFPFGKYALLRDFWKHFKYVFYNESDQVIFSNRLGAYLTQLDDSNYLSPHRFERDFRRSNCRNQPIVKYNEINYVHYNAPRHTSNELVTKCQTFKESYGAAWIAKSESVKKADFNLPEGDGLHAPCLAMFKKLTALKTSQCLDFFADHLGGYSNALEVAGFDIENFPNCW